MHDDPPAPGASPAIGTPCGWRIADSRSKPCDAMIWSRVMDLVAYVRGRRNVHWIEISVSRAWSHDMPARLFDLGDR
jgi:hypothetical protein